MGIKREKNGKRKVNKDAGDAGWIERKEIIHLIKFVCSETTWLKGPGSKHSFQYI